LTDDIYIEFVDFDTGDLIATRSVPPGCVPSQYHYIRLGELEALRRVEQVTWTIDADEVPSVVIRLR